MTSYRAAPTLCAASESRDAGGGGGFWNEARSTPAGTCGSGKSPMWEEATPHMMEDASGRAWGEPRTSQRARVGSPVWESDNESMVELVASSQFVPAPGAGEAAATTEDGVFGVLHLQTPREATTAETAASASRAQAHLNPPRVPPLGLRGECARPRRCAFSPGPLIQSTRDRSDKSSN